MYLEPMFQKNFQNQCRGCEPILDLVRYSWLQYFGQIVWTSPREDHHRVAMAAIFGNLYLNGNDVVVSR